MDTTAEQESGRTLPALSQRLTVRVRDGEGRSGVSRDRRTYDGHLRNRLQRPLRRLDPGRLRGNAGPVPLETRGGADEHVARGRVGLVGQRVRHVAWGEGKLARGLGQQLLVDLEDELALEYVEDLV